MKGMDSLVDTLVNAVCKAVGISTDEVREHFETLKINIPAYAQRAMNYLSTTDARLAALEEQNRIITSQNVLILEALHQLNGDTLPAGQGMATDMATAPKLINGAASQE